MIDKGFIHERDDESDSAANEPEVDEDGLEVEHEDDDDIPGSEGDEQCLNIFQQVEQAPLVKPLGKCVTIPNADGVLWKV